MLPRAQRSGTPSDPLVAAEQLIDCLIDAGRVGEALAVGQAMLPSTEALPPRTRLPVEWRVGYLLAAAGEPERAVALAEERILLAARAVDEPGTLGVVLAAVGEWLVRAGRLDEALRLWGDEAIPALRAAGRLREVAATQAQRARLGASSGLAAPPTPSGGLE